MIAATATASARTAVSTDAGALATAGFIRYMGGVIMVVDRRGLEETACECYRIVRAEFDRLATQRR